MHISHVASCAAAAFLLHGCGESGADTSTSATTTTTTTTREPSTNFWQFRNDEDMGPQTNFDMGLDTNKSLYGGCWKADFRHDSGLKGVETLAGGQYMQYTLPMADQFIEESVEEGRVVNKTYGTYDGEVGVTLFNKRNSTDMGGCLMRKSRLPVDLSVIGRMELDITAKGSSENAPWYAVWMAPMLYSGVNDATKAAEIDIIENYDYMKRGSDSSLVKTTFAQCGQPGDYSWTQSVCKAMDWHEKAGRISTHITLKALNLDGKRVLRVYRCSQPATHCDESSDYAEIKVESDPPAPDIDPADWFPVWNKAKAKEWYGHYWIVADIWWTSDTDFELSVGNASFYFDNGTAWEMPLDGTPPNNPVTTTPIPGPEGSCCSGDNPLYCCGSAEGCCPAGAENPLWCCSRASAEMV
jgi:hypothetical protein